MQTVIAALNSIAPLGSELENHLSQILQPFQFDKKQYVSRIDHVPHYIYFVEKGLIRGFYRSNTGKETTTWIMKENDIIVNVISFFSQTKALETIETLEESLLWGVTFQDLENTFIQYPSFNEHGRKIAINYYQLSELHHYRMDRQTALDRFKALIESSPDLLDRVSNAYLASYLRMNQETLSRIKKKYYQEQKDKGKLMMGTTSLIK